MLFASQFELEGLLAAFEAELMKLAKEGPGKAVETDAFGVPGGEPFH